MRVSRLTAMAVSLVAIGFCVNIAAAGNVPRTGDQRVGLFACAFPGPCVDISLTANQPFFVAHGFSGEPKADLVNPLHRFELTVDGNSVQGAIDLDLQAEGLSKFYVFNFRFGMTGTHSFTGCWYKTDGSLDACGTRIVHFL